MADEALDELYRVKPEDFFSKQDIENARSRMQGWVNSLARTGR